MSLFPGGVALTDLVVYDEETPDGCRGGSPHLHTASSEGYVVVGGSGAVQTVSAAGYAEDALRPGDVLWFSPGTVHRLVNHGDLRLLVVMSNAGLPEAGDAVLTFPSPSSPMPRLTRRRRRCRRDPIVQMPCAGGAISPWRAS